MALAEVNDREKSPALHESDRELLSGTLSGLSAAISTEKAKDHA
ncbi:hypothetical protein [Kitasatospora aureofaciens]|nr:hypothetical protein [Kitasatospora aureofaciens]